MSNSIAVNNPGISIVQPLIFTVLQHFPYEELNRFQTLPRSTKNDMARTYESQSSLHSAVNHALGSSKGNWLIPALHVVCRNTHKVAALADEYVNRSTGNRNDHARLQNAVTLLQASYSKTLNDRVELRVSGNVRVDGC